MRENIRLLWKGFHMAVAFLTIFPAANVSWEEKTARHAVFSFPVCGLFIGTLTAGLVSVSLYTLVLPNYLLAFIIMAMMMVLHGGIHLDGWMDVSDAAGSWRDKEKRLEIMKDSRTGAAAVWTTMLLLGSRFLCIFYFLESQLLSIWFLLLVIPVLSRTAMAHLLIAAPLAKKEGLAAWFRKEIRRRDSVLVLFICGIFISVMLMLIPGHFLSGLLLVVSAGITYWVARLYFHSAFGGINGDMAGALCEGMETILWMSIALYISYAMV